MGISNRKYYFLSGLPRSGSTVLASILSQNPEIYVSPTSPLVGLMNGTNKIWNDADQVAAYYSDAHYSSIMKGIVDNLYFDIKKPIIIDKNRAWPNPHNISLLRRTFGTEPLIICTVRDIPDILASFIKLIRRSPLSLSFIDKELIKMGWDLNDENRIKWLMTNDGHVFQSWYVLREGFNKDLKNLLLVEYEDLVQKPLYVLNRIYNFLELSLVDHNFENIENKVQENDNIYSLPGMHTIRPKLEKDRVEAVNILGERLYDMYEGGAFWRA